MTESLEVHKLSGPWTIYFFNRDSRSEPKPDFVWTAVPITQFDTVEGFWSSYGHLKRIYSLPFISEYHVFRTGIEPKWEDEANADGGKWIIRLSRRPLYSSQRADKQVHLQHKKGRENAALIWENLLLSIIGGDFFGDEVEESEITGCVVSARFNEDIISVWNRHGEDMDIIEKIHKKLQQVLHLNETEYNAMRYKKHSSSLKRLKQLESSQ